MDMTQEYEDIIKQLENVKYFLRIQGRQEEAEAISAALIAAHEAYKLSKTLPKPFMK